MQLNFDKIFFNFFENLILVILILSWSVDHWLNQFQLVIWIDHLNWSENKNIAKNTKTVTAALTHTIWKYMEVVHRPSPSSVFWRVFYHVFFGCSYHSRVSRDISWNTESMFITEQVYEQCFWSNKFIVSIGNVKSNKKDCSLGWNFNFSDCIRIQLILVTRCPEKCAIRVFL